MEDIAKLKTEIFDLIREQDMLRIKYAQTERLKQDKLKELERLEDGTDRKEA